MNHITETISGQLDKMMWRIIKKWVKVKFDSAQIIKILESMILLYQSYILKRLSVCEPKDSYKLEIVMPSKCSL